MDHIKVYAARIREPGDLMNSSSGGVFTALSDVILENGGAVAASVYDYESHQTVFRLLENKEERNMARGSKYMQSHTGFIFRECERWLKEHPDKELLFLGTGCQAAVFRKYMEIRKLKDRVITADIVCHGVSSPKVWKEYAELLEEKLNGKMSLLSFKDKRFGWKKPYAYAVVGENEISVRDYMKLYSGKLIIRPSCHFCPYTTLNRNTDITIGDFWGIDVKMPEFYSSDGNSLVLVHSDKGERLFSEAKKSLQIHESTEEACLQPNLISPTSLPKKRRAFWKHYYKFGVEYVLKKYGAEK